MENILSFLQTGWYWILIGIAALVLLLKFLPRYKIAPPDRALIISGLIRRNYKVRNPDGTISTKKFGYRIVRGGSWTSSPQDCRSAFRGREEPDSKSYEIGFRICVTNGYK